MEVRVQKSERMRTEGVSYRSCRIYRLALVRAAD